MKASGIVSALVLAHAAFAQSASNTTSGSSTGKSSASSLSISESKTSSDGNPLIPSSASAACTTFLNALNTDTAIASCFTPLLNALSAFNPSTGTGSASSVSKALTTLCGSSACSSSTMRAKLTDFKDACGNELTGATPNDVIIKDYDVIYALTPFKSAVCARDATTQAYCVLNIGSSSSSSSGTTQNVTARSESISYASSHLTNALVSSNRKRAQTVLVPNMATYRSSHLIYLFTSPDMNAGELCTSCTQQIISKYFAFQSVIPYALGPKNSPLLGGQSELWAAMQEKCPASFLTEISNMAGVATAEDINSGALPSLDAGSIFTALAGALAAALALV